LDIWLYIRVFLYYILYNFYRRVFEFMCMTKKGVMVFLFLLKKTAFFSFNQRSAAVPYCMIKENSTCNSIYQETLRERFWYTLSTNTLLHLKVLWQTLPNMALQKHSSHSMFFEWRTSFYVDYFGTSDGKRPGCLRTTLLCSVHTKADNDGCSSVRGGIPLPLTQ